MACASPGAPPGNSAARRLIRTATIASPWPSPWPLWPPRAPASFTTPAAPAYRFRNFLRRLNGSSSGEDFGRFPQAAEPGSGGGGGVPARGSAALRRLAQADGAVAGLQPERRTICAELAFELGVAVQSLLLRRKLAELAFDVALARFGLHLEARLRRQHHLNAAGGVDHLHLFAWRLGEAQLDVAVAVLDVHAPGDVFQHHVVFSRRQRQIAWRVGDLQPPRASVNPAGQLGNGQIGAMRDETRALGGLLDADGAVELAFDHRLAIDVGDFDLAALPGELHVAPRADDVDVAAGLLDADVAAGVADLDLAAPAVAVTLPARPVTCTAPRSVQRFTLDRFGTCTSRSTCKPVPWPCGRTS